MRCPHCGNDVGQAQHSCHVCGTTLLVDALEATVPFFQRHEERWRKPMSTIERIKLVFINPSRAMWDITHKPTRTGPGLAFLANVLLFGLLGPILQSKIQSDEPWAIFPGWNAFTGFGLYLAFVVIGLLYFGLLWGFTILAQTIGVKMIANVVPAWKKQGDVIGWAFVPSILAAGVYILVIWIGVPTVPVESIPLMFFPAGSTQATGAWMIADIALMVFYFGYLPVLLAIAYREQYDKSTLRCLVSAGIVAAICAGIFVFTRATFPIFILQ